MTIRGMKKIRWWLRPSWYASELQTAAWIAGGLEVDANPSEITPVETTRLDIFGEPSKIVNMRTL